MVHHQNQQLDFIPGTSGRISVRGTTKTAGCKFIMVDMSKNLTCCFSATSRGVSLCHPDTQSDGCRKKDRCDRTFFVIIISSFLSLWLPFWFPGSQWKSYLEPVCFHSLTLTKMMLVHTRSSSPASSETTSSLSWPREVSQYQTTTTRAKNIDRWILNIKYRRYFFKRKFVIFLYFFAKKVVYFGTSGIRGGAHCAPP